MSEIVKREQGEVSPYQSAKAFEQFWPLATSLADTSMVPKDYQRNPNNVMVAIDMALRMKASPLAVMQNLYIIEGKPSWSSQFIIAAIQETGQFSALRWRTGSDGPLEIKYWENNQQHTQVVDNQWAIAYATELSTGQILEGPKVSMAMAVGEGWYGKKMSKWKTMPELMLRYRSAAFFGRMYAPGVLMGLKTQEEAHDIEDAEFTEVKPAKSPGEAVKNLGKQTQAPQSADVTDALEKAQTVPNIHVVTTGERTGKLGASRKTQKQAAQPLEVQEATVAPQAETVIPPVEQGEDNGDWNF